MPETDGSPATGDEPRLEVDPAAAPVVWRLAAQLLMAPEGLVVVSVETADWPDACLGLAAEGEIGAAVVTPGYRVVVRAGIDTYEFRTDLAGSNVRLASAPPARTGEALVTWRDSRSFATLIIGTQRVALGRRGQPMIAAPLAVPARATELQGFLAHFAPFQAQTAAGDIALRGVGSARPSVTEQRMIAEWARIVSLEARSGAEQPEATIALRWQQRGGPGEVCDRIEITRTGEARASSCRGSESIPIATIALSPEELAVLYGWLDRFEAFEAARPQAADGAVTSVVFRGSGVDEAAPTDSEALLSWIDGIAVRLRAAALR